MSCSFAKPVCFSHAVLSTFPSATADKSWFSFAHPAPAELVVCREPAPLPSALSSEPDSSPAASMARDRTLWGARLGQAHAAPKGGQARDYRRMLRRGGRAATGLCARSWCVPLKEKNKRYRGELWRYVLNQWFANWGLQSSAARLGTIQADRRCGGCSRPLGEGASGRRASGSIPLPAAGDRLRPTPPPRSAGSASSARGKALGRGIRAVVLFLRYKPGPRSRLR